MGRATSVRSRGIFCGGGGAGSAAGGDCGAGPVEGGGAASRSILASCSVSRDNCSSARLICSCACVSRSSPRGAEASCVSASFEPGVEVIGVFVSSNVVRSDPASLRAVLPKQWPYHGRISDHTAIARANPADYRRRAVPVPGPRGGCFPARCVSVASPPSPPPAGASPSGGMTR